MCGLTSVVARDSHASFIHRRDKLAGVLCVIFIHRTSRLVRGIYSTLTKIKARVLHRALKNGGFISHGRIRDSLIEVGLHVERSRAVLIIKCGVSAHIEFHV